MSYIRKMSSCCLVKPNCLEIILGAGNRQKDVNEIEDKKAANDNECYLFELFVSEKEIKHDY